MSWKTKPLGEILDQSGRHRAGDQDLPVLSITMKHGLVDQADKFKKRIASVDTANYRIAYKNELVVGFPIDEGVLGFQTKYPAGIVSPAYNIWKLKNELDCYIPYLERYLRSSQARSLYASRMQGAVARRRSLTNADFLELEIPFPTFDDQIRIAHLLDKVEGLLTQRKKHLQQLDDLLKSVFLEMFGDPVRNEKRWDKPGLKAFGKISTGNTPPRKEPANYDDYFIEWIKTDNITGHAVFVTPSTEHLSELGTRKSRTVTSGALLVACIAGSVESIGRAALTDRTVSFNQQINAIQPGKDVNSLYLYGLFKLCRAYIQSHASKGMKKILTKGNFEQIAMIKPPFEAQNRFAVIVGKVEAIKSRYQQSLTDLIDLYGALSQQAFKGELDLSRVALPDIKRDQERLDVESSESAIEPNSTATRFTLPELPKGYSLTGKKRQEALRHWFDYALKVQQPGAVFEPSALVDAVNFRLEIMDDDHAFDSEDNDILRDWLFEALRAGRVEQVVNIAGTESAGEPITGNIVQLIVAQVVG